MTASHRVLHAAVLALEGGSGAEPSASVLLYPSPGVPGGVGVAHMCLVHSQRERADCVRHLYRVAREWALVPVVVTETWPLYGTHGLPNTLLSGEARGRWLAELERVAEENPGSHVLQYRMDPHEWRTAVWGSGQRLRRDVLRDRAAQHALDTLGFPVRIDVAEVVCLGLFAVRHQRIHDEVAKWEKRSRALAKAG